MFFLNPVLLIGLSAAAIPLAVHFLARRRHDEVEWGAMRFLRLGPKSRRKLFLERWVLMAVRMAVLGLLAMALAAPAVRTTARAGEADRRPRDTAILVDCSGSMANGNAAATARRWAAEFLGRARPGDRVAVFAVKGDAVSVVGLTPDFEQARASLELLPEPRGTANWPAAVEVATAMLRDRGEPELLILTDGQRFGWADADSLARWELLARTLAAEGQSLPRTWVANVVPDRATPPPATLKPIASNRTTAATGAAVNFECGLRYSGTAPRVKLEVDGRAAGDVPILAAPDAAFTITRRFAPGSHVVTVRLDPPSPPGVRQDFALDVLPLIPVLIVGGNDFLRDALAPARDSSPAFAVRTVTAEQFTPATLTQDVKGPSTRPRVLVLANVATLTAEQSGIVERFLTEGGGVLVTAGDRTDAAAWNRVARRWLPARLAAVVSSDGDPTAGPKPRTASIEHPALRAFRDDLPGGLHTAYFPQHWRLEPDPTPPRAEVMLSLSDRDPLFVGKAVGRGRVVVSAVPLDRSWRTNLVGLPDYVRLAHELAYSLAGTADTPANLAPGEPIVFRPRDDEPAAAVTVVPPGGVSRVVPLKAWPLTFDATHDPGVYRVTSGAGTVRYFAVRADPREADLTRADATDVAKLAATLGNVEFVESADDLTSRRGRGAVAQEFGGLVLLGVLALLATELWYTRRLGAATA